MKLIFPLKSVPHCSCICRVIHAAATCTWTDFLHVLIMVLIARPYWAQILNYHIVEAILASTKPQRSSQPDYPLSTIERLPFLLLSRATRAAGRICSWLWLARWQRRSDDWGIMCKWWDIRDRSHETVLFSLSTNGTFFLFPESKTNLFPELVQLPWLQLESVLVMWALANWIFIAAWLACSFC